MWYNIEVKWRNNMVDWKKIKSVHCIGIGGVGLSAIAEVLMAKGIQISGSDMNQNDKIEKLLSKGVPISLGHRGKNVKDADLLVYSSAIAKDNPELLKAQEMGIPCLSRAEVLGELMTGYDNSIAIAGTHGKTTTTSMISLILRNAALEPTILVGGTLAEIGGNVQIGEKEYFVTEACEYMDSFLSLKPKIEIILNIDSDHLDYFKDIDHIVHSFDRFTQLLPQDGLLIAYDANPFVKKIIKERDRVVTFGFSGGCTYSGDDITFNEKGYPSFSVFHKEQKICHLTLSVPGEHNLLNALAAIACCHSLGVSIESIVETLGNYRGTQRRFDELGETRQGLRIVDDYAHHPTEIMATLKAARNMKNKNIWCVFQPHTYTRTMALFEEFPPSFQGADKIVLTEIYAAREKNIYNISAKNLLVSIKEKYPEKEVYFFEEFDEIANFIYHNADAEDLILIMGAGDIYKVGEKILEKDGPMRGEKIE